MNESDFGDWNLRPNNPAMWWLAMEQKPDEDLIADMLDAERNGGSAYALNIYYRILKPRLEKSNPEKLELISKQLEEIFTERMSQAKLENEIRARREYFENNMPDTLESIFEYFRTGGGSPE